MEGEDTAAREALEKSVINHRTCATEAFLRGLEDEMHGPIEVAGTCEMLRCAKQHRDVSVMAAAVEHAWRTARVWHACLLLDGQRVHVGAKADRLIGNPHFEDADETGPADSAMHFDPRLAKK
jgi:hypothetical protein